MWDRVGGLRTVALGTPGPSRDRLNRLVLEGAKTATAGLYEVEYVAEEEAIETVGERLVLLDSDEAPIGVIEVTRVETYPFLEVPWEFAAAENEGDETIEDWRRGHREFFDAVGTPVRDGDRMVCIWFRLLDEPPPTRA